MGYDYSALAAHLRVVWRRRFVWIYWAAPERFDIFFERERRSNFRNTRDFARLRLGYDIDLDHPRTFSEKLIHRRLFSRDPVWTVVADKLAVRDWARARLSEHELKLIPLQDVIDNPRRFDLSTIAGPAIIKAAWSAGRNIFVTGDDLDAEGIKETLVQWWENPYKPEHLVWATPNIPLRYVVEDLIPGNKTELPEDYKFFVIHGRVQFVEVHFDRFGDHRIGWYLPSGERAGISFARDKPADRDLDLPPGALAKMVSVAERLGSEFDFVRVDLYFSRGNVYLGEITQTPALGFDRFSSFALDEALGRQWHYAAMDGSGRRPSPDHS